MKGYDWKMLKYTSILKSRPYFYIELKKAGSLMLEGLSLQEVKEKAVKENLFSMTSEARKKEVASTIVNRLKVIDNKLLDVLCNGVLMSSKQIALYTILKTDRLFFEFMNEVYREKIILNDFTLTDKDFNIFFRAKSVQSEKIASWKEYTFYKLKQVYKRILTEAGFIKGRANEVIIVQQIMEKELRDYLKQINDGEFVKTMLGES